MRSFIVGVLAAPIIALVPLSALAQSSQPVPTGELIEKVDIPYESFTLDNGLRVLVHTDRKAPIVAVSVWYDVGSKDEPKGKTGFAHLFEHLMFNGTESVPGDFFEPLQQMGATDVNGTTSFDRTNYFETVPTGGLERTLFLESERMGHLLGAVTRKTLDNQRGVVQNEKRQRDNQPYGLVEYARLAALLPEGHPYGHSTIGSMADLDAASLEDVRDWFRQYYGPNNAVLVLAGDVDVETAKPLVERYFGDIARGPEKEPVIAPIPTLAARKDEVMKDRVATTQISRSWVVPGLNDPDTVPLSVGASVLGGLATSRLENILVREEKVALNVSARVEMLAQIGFFEVRVEVTPGADTEMVSQRLDAILADYIEKGPTADEVKRVVMRKVAGDIAGLESVGGFGGKAVALAEGLLYSGDPDFYKKQLAAYATTTPAQVTAALRKWLKRPVYALRVVPGERDPYEEAAASQASAPQEDEKPRPAPASGNEASAGAKAALDRSKLPELGKIEELDFPTVARTKLSNGIEIVYANRNAVPLTQIALSLDAGDAADPKPALGTQSLMLSLLEEGTTSLDSLQIAERQEILGARINSYASMDRTDVNLSALSGNLAPSLDLFADIVRNPAFAPDKVEQQRQRQLAAIAKAMTEPFSLAFRTLPPLLYGTSHPYGAPGTGDPAAVAGIGRDDLIAFHRAWFRPEKARFFVVSDRPLADIEPLLEARFGEWQGVGPVGTKVDDAPVPVPSPRIVLIDRKDSPQSLIIGGLVLPVKGTEKIADLIAANEVLGGGFLSRINMDLRETKGWSYGVSARVNRVEGQVPFMVSAPVQADKTGPALTALRNEIKAFLTDRGVTAAELERTKNGRIREIPGRFETAYAVLYGMQRNDLYGRPDDYYDRLAENYRGMTAARLNSAARAAIRDDQMLWVIVGDADKVKDQLEPLDLPLEIVPSAPQL
ncbi:M16 family metallopeptidase [Nitratireductor luteus]|uniref:M16 family metallopeptidase n=1 Tax=Nitratireductor luteus TaxID=2976980 RepID=UPI00223E9884|nr:pitrilysin family protein [Nitratireductor luteus]